MADDDLTVFQAAASVAATQRRGMGREKFLIVGGGGRESAFAVRLAEEVVLYAVIGHKNPTIIEHVQMSGGDYLIGNHSDPATVAAFAREKEIDYVFVSADQPLANGVVDALLNAGIKAVGGTREATRIEWDKVYSIDLMNDVCPEFTPFYKVISSREEVEVAIAEFRARQVELVVKPQGLTGGKGVKVMPEHLQSYEDAGNYAAHLLDEKPDEQVLLVEKLVGIEFTIMGLTDGENLVISPASYDYPFRFENDHGAGTGGMGCFTDKGIKLPFMAEQDLVDCEHVMQSVIDRMRAKGILFNGVLNAGFFLTADGIKFMEFNGRFGDPEGLNILTLLQSSFSQLIKDLWDKTLTEERVVFLEQASVIKYLVAAEYPDASRETVSFSIDRTAIEAMGLNVFFASAIHLSGNQYQTLRTSRVVAIGAVADTVSEAAKRINLAIETHITGRLDYRRDIGSEENLKKMNNLARSFKSRAR